MDRVLLKYPGINAEGDDNQHLYNMRNHGGIHHLHELEEFIRYASQSYYEGSPKVPDAAFEEAVALLKLNDPTNELLTKPGWGYQPSRDKIGYFGEFSHNPKMTSIPLEHRFKLDKVLADRIPLISSPFVVMPKYNGGSGRAYYENGQLKLLLSRGDGSKGLDVRDNFILGDSVPVEVKDESLDWVDGEFVVSRTDYISHFKHAPAYANQSIRDVAINLCEGMNNELHTEPCLKFIAYGSNRNYTYAYGLDLLTGLGFTTTWFKHCIDWKEFTDLVNDFGELARMAGDYDTDGFILRNEDKIIAIKR